MSRRFGRTRCLVCRSWDPGHTCPSTAAVMQAAFGGPGRLPMSFDTHCWEPGCECRGSRAAA